MTVTIITGDCRKSLKALPDQSAHCCVTSPPYFGLRDYGNDGQIGLEQSPCEYIAQLVDVFREVRRILRDDGTLWLNLGDSYAGNGGQTPQTGELFKGRARQRETIMLSARIAAPGLKPKDLIGIPWRVAFALQADGWWLRQDIIWAKPNPMPESVTDRCTKSHEYLFLLTKSERYYFDQDAIAEPVTGSTIERLSQPNIEKQGGSITPSKGNGAMKAVMKRSGNKERKPPAARGVPADGNGDVAGSIPWEGTTRNKRSVWTVATTPFKDAHFATFPPALIEPCVLAGCPQGGIVLDPFGGAGTTGLVADRLHRDAVLLELNPDYAAMAEARIRVDGKMFARVVMK
jgi:DNA modification methylase